MASEPNGMDSTSIDWSFAASQAFLPPRSPLFAGGVPGLLDNIDNNNNNNNNNSSINSFFSNCPKAPLPSGPGSRRHHQRTPSTSFLPQTPVWVDELLNDTPDLPPPRNVHRRSSSDSLTFFEAPLQHVHISDIAAEEELNPGRNVILPPKALRDDEWMKITGNGSYGLSQNNASHGNAIMQAFLVESRLPFESSSALSDRDSGNGSSVEDKRSGGFSHFKNDTEVQSALKADSSTMNLSSADTSLDPKRAKRVLANRQSAQRSRVRKLQYIAELERTVNVLQEEVSALSPQVTYLDRHRILLNVDNSAMKQKIAALAQDKLFKNAHNQALKLEVHRLRQLYQQQKQKLVPQSNISSEATQQQFTSQLELTDLDVSLDAAKCAEYVFKGSEADLLESHAAAAPQRLPFVKPVGPSSCSSTEKAKVLSMPGLEQLHTDFRVQNP